MYRITGADEPTHQTEERLMFNLTTKYNLTTKRPDPRNPRKIKWRKRRARAVVPFVVQKGVPVNPVEPNLPEGRGELWHWGEAVATDALVIVVNSAGKQLLMVERDDDHGWAVPGGCLDKGETPEKAMVRELKEETGLVLPKFVKIKMQEGRYVPDPRAGRAAWMVTVPGVAVYHTDTLPEVTGRDDARRALWLPANNYAELEGAVANLEGKVFAAHVDMLRNLLG